MNASTIKAVEALKGLQLRLAYTEAITNCVAEDNDTRVGDAIRGIALIISDIGDRLDEIIDAAMGARS